MDPFTIATGVLALGRTLANNSNKGNMRKFEEQLRLQEESQQRLNEQAMALNYQYGEQAAENAYERQLELYKRSYQDQSYSAMRKQMEDAGLSVGLMYGGGASGGAGGATTGAPQGSTSGVTGGQATKASEMEALRMQRMALGLDLQQKAANIGLTVAQTEKERASANLSRWQAKLTETEQITQEKIRNFVIEGARNDAISSWLDSIAKKWDMEIGPDSPHTVWDEDNEILLESVRLKTGSYLDRKDAEEINNLVASTASLDADAWLKTEKAKGYWQELLNDTAKANAEGVKANAIKLMAEIKDYLKDAQFSEMMAHARAMGYTTGDVITWKTFAELGADYIKIAVDAFKAFMDFKLGKGKSNQAINVAPPKKQPSKVLGADGKPFYGGEYYIIK